MSFRSFRLPPKSNCFPAETRIHVAAFCRKYVVRADQSRNDWSIGESARIFGSEILGRFLKGTNEIVAIDQHTDSGALTENMKSTLETSRNFTAVGSHRLEPQCGFPAAVLNTMDARCGWTDGCRA